MKYSLKRTNSFSIQLEDILNHIENNFGNLATRKALGRLKKSMQSIENNPHIGFEISSKILVRTQWRALIVGKSILFYVVDDTKKEVVLCAIVDQRTDYMDIIDELK